MQGYAEQIPPRDRWMIAAYVRALQLSQNASLDDVPAADRPRLDETPAAAAAAAGPEGGALTTGQRLGTERPGRQMTADTYNPPESLSGFQSKGQIAAAIGAVLAVIGFVMTGLDRFYEAYLVAWVYWTGVALGSLALLMLQHLTGGAWGVVIRRILEAATRTLPVMAVLGLPILAGMGHLYHWTHADVAAADPMIRDKAAYLNVPVLHRPLRPLLRHLVVPGAAAERLVGRAGSHRRSGAGRQDERASRAAACWSSA